MSNRFATYTREELVERIETLEKANSEQAITVGRLAMWNRNLMDNYGDQRDKWSLLTNAITQCWNNTDWPEVRSAMEELFNIADDIEKGTYKHE